MPDRGIRSRVWYTFGATSVIAAAAWQVYRAHLPLRAFELEAVLFGCGVLYSAFAIYLQGRRLGQGTVAKVAMTAINIVLATGILAVAAPYLAAPLPFAFAILTTTVLAAILATPEDQPTWLRPIFATGGAVAGLVVTWTQVRGAQAGVDALLIWAGMLAGIGMLIEVHWRLGRMAVDTRVAHMASIAAVSHKLGSTTDVSEVTAAVLQAFKDAYPFLNWGGILLWDTTDEELESVPVALTPGGITRGADPEAPKWVIRSGEGLAGEAFATGMIRYRSNFAEATRDDTTRPLEARLRMIRRVGPIHAAVSCPLRSADDEVIGVVTLGSTTESHAWSMTDMVLVQGIADQAGVAIERGRLYDEQRHQALTDPLTGLPNRREFERKLSQRAADAQYGIIAIDLDNLKMINDEHGHEAGDAVLRLVSTTIKAGLRPRDFVARVGGDEFAVLLPDADLETTHDVAERITHSMKGVAVPYGAARISAGCAASGPERSTPREVWNVADEALYRAKSAGRNRVEVLHPAIGNGERLVRWGEVLPSLLDARRVSAVYQPIIRLSDREVMGFEALARPGGQGDSVEGLFAAALRMGLSRDLDWLCRRAALDQSREFPPGTAIFINVGVPGLMDPLHDVDQMLLLLQWANREPREVVLELSEREAVTDLERFRQVLHSYRDEGFRFAMDDVGEGHSTLEVLAAGEPEYIKIARTLTQSAEKAGPRAAIQALAAFGASTGATLIAEGIEDMDDLRLMRDLGVELGQGYGIGRPAAAESFRTEKAKPGKPRLRILAS